MADWMQDQSEADRKALDRLRGLRDDARDAYNAEMRRQKTKYEQRRRRSAAKRETSQAQTANGTQDKEQG